MKKGLFESFISYQNKARIESDMPQSNAI